MFENQNPLTPAERELESALARLAPSPPPDRRESIAYEAGFRAGQRRPAILWRTTSAALAASLALTLLLRPTPNIEPQPLTQYVSLAPHPPIPPTPHLPVALASSSSSFPDQSYLFIRDQVLSHGLDALPAPTPTASSSDPAPRVRNIQPISSLFGGRS